MDLKTLTTTDSFTFHFAKEDQTMPKIQQTVTFTQDDIKNVLIDKAKEQIKAETGKDPTGASSFTFQATSENETGAVVLFQCNGKR